MSTNKTNKNVFIAFLCPYPRGGAPSQRFRYEQYLPPLTQAGVSYEIYPFLDERTNRILYQPGRTGAKALGLVRGLLRRIAHIARASRASYVFIHREATPVGLPWVEWLLAKVLQRRIIYDFDDAIWLADRSSVNRLVALAKWQRKVPTVCRWSYRVSAGNTYLVDFARQHNQRVVVNPTTIDTEHHHNRLQDQSTDQPVIGWTGSHSTLKYLEPLVPVLQQLERKHSFRFIVIANRAPTLPLSSLEFIHWQPTTEIDDLLRMHIGLMPLPDDRWARGKCGFKALQYLALGIPALVSPVGVNAQIVEPGTEGFHCVTGDDWYQHLATLLADQSLRAKMGAAGRKKVVERYSVRSNTDNFLGLFAD